MGALGISVEPRRKPVPTNALRPDEEAPVKQKVILSNKCYQ